MSVLWDLGRPGPDVVREAQAGADHGRVVRQLDERRSALRGYVDNPNDPAAQSALTVADPAMSLQFRDQRLQEDHARHTQAIEALGEHRDRIIMGAQFLQNVNDEAGYQQALQLARQNGIPLDDVPQHFDPQYVQGIITTAQHLQAVQHPMEPPTIARDVSYYRSIGRDDLAQQALTRHAEGPPSVVSNGDGTFTILPPSVTHPQGAQPGGTPQAGEIQEGYRFRGGNPADPNAWEPVAGGGAGQPQARGTFPRQDGGAFDFSVNPANR